MNGLDMAIRESGAAAYVLFASSADADMRYLTRFVTTDPVAYIRKAGERGTLVVSQMEYGRAAEESPAAVVTRSDAGFMEYLKEGDSRLRATARMIAALAGGAVLVPRQFPLGLAREIERFCPVFVDSGSVESMRAVKTAEEVAEIRAVQRAAEKAMETALSLIRGAHPHDGELFCDGEPLTSERVKAEMHKVLLDYGCRGKDTIVSCGEETAQPHAHGSGPLLPNEPIVIDIYPQSEISGYHADMTRTVVYGEATPEIREMYLAVHEAKELAIPMIRAGANGTAIHQRVVDYFCERGYPGGTDGFIHNLGHGVGLEVHEQPSLGVMGDELRTGHVVTVEPGLYYPGIGGVRLEDMGAVTDTGFVRFTRCDEELIL